MLSPTLLVLGLMVFGCGCRTFANIRIRKLGLVAFMAASFVLFYTVSGSWLLGTVGVAIWFCLPWIELLTRVRKMDLPVDRPLRRRIAPTDGLAFLDSASKEIEDTSTFEYIDDWGYQWQGSDHFFRVLYDATTKTQAIICLTMEESFTHAYLKLVSRDLDGQVYTTWNYPFAASLKQSPQHRLHWDRTSATFNGILNSHLDFLERSVPSHDDIALQDPDDFMESLRSDQQRLVDHNLSLGVLARSGKGVYRYTWKGLLYLWTQLVKDMVRLH